jgi:hypothetical protein
MVVMVWGLLGYVLRFPPPFTGEVLSVSEAEGARSALSPLAACGGTPPVNRGRKARRPIQLGLDAVEGLFHRRDLVFEHGDAFDRGAVLGLVAFEHGDALRR